MRPADLPSVWEREEELLARLSGRRPAVYLDYDGTLTPIVDDHRKALLAPEMRAAVAELSGLCPVAVVSGRDLEMLRRLVGIDTIFYAGSHGFEITGPEGTIDTLERGTEFLHDLDEAEAELRPALSGIAGSAIERKRFSIAIHYRLATPDGRAAMEKAVEATLRRHPGLALGHGKKVFELQPDIEWNKGKAVLWLQQQLGLDGPGFLPVYIGDDLTDEHAFQALSGRGVGVVVGRSATRTTAADYAVADTSEVARLIALLAENARKGAPDQE